jgi:hypothetical protein
LLLLLLWRRRRRVRVEGLLNGAFEEVHDDGFVGGLRSDYKELSS